jgi:hypothetical protein
MEPGDRGEGDHGGGALVVLEGILASRRADASFGSDFPVVTGGHPVRGPDRDESPVNVPGSRFGR